LHNPEKRPLTLLSRFVSLSAGIGVSPAGQISIRFHMGSFFGYLSRNAEFGYKRTKILNTLREDVSLFH
jgi:hypothetical protein